MNTAITDVPYGQAALGILPVLMADLRHTLGATPVCVLGLGGTRQTHSNCKQWTKHSQMLSLKKINITENKFHLTQLLRNLRLNFTARS